MKYLLIAFVVALTSPASAMIFEMDLYDSGDALITRDTDAGLDWLDVTLTNRIGGVPAVLEGAGGWLDAGWRLATTVEVCSFFGRASGSSLTCPGVTYELGSFGQPILDLLGMTDEREQPYGNGTLYLDQIWAAFDDGDLSDRAGGVELSVDTHSDGWVQTYIRVADNWQPSESVLLVRPIPEPSTGVIFGMGVAALGFCRRWRASCVPVDMEVPEPLLGRVVVELKEAAPTADDEDEMVGPVGVSLPIRTAEGVDVDLAGSLAGDAEVLGPVFGTIADWHLSGGLVASERISKF